MIAIPMRVAVTEQAIPMSIATSNVNLSAQLGASFSVVDADIYEGEYTFTPSEETQTILTKNKYLEDNIVINPIPSNYGKITYNGSVITVS